MANLAWLFLWYYEYFRLTMVAMVGLLLLLIAIYLRLGIGRNGVSPTERWLVRLPFSIYVGWVTVATIANASSLLYYLNWRGWGLSPETWTIIMLVAVTAITAAVAFTRGNIASGLVIVWAFAGIAIRHAGVPIVSTTAWVLTAIVGVLTAIGAWINRHPTPSVQLTG